MGAMPGETEGAKKRQMRIKIVSMGAAESGKVRVHSARPVETLYYNTSCLSLSELPDQALLREEIRVQVHIYAGDRLWCDEVRQPVL